MKKRVLLFGIAIIVFLALTGCDMTKLEGFSVVCYIDSDVEEIGTAYSYETVKDSRQNDVRRFVYDGNGGQDGGYTVLFDGYKCSVTDIAANDGLFMIVSNPSGSESMGIRLELFDAGDNSDSTVIETGLMDFAGNVIIQPEHGYIRIPAGFSGVIYCPFGDSSPIMNILHPDMSYKFGFSLEAPEAGESASLDTYAALMYRNSDGNVQPPSFDATGIEYGALKTLQDFEGELDSGFISQDSGIIAFASAFEGGVYSGNRSLLVINSANGNQTHLYEYTEGDAQPVLEGSALSELNFIKNGTSPNGMYFLISVPDNYSTESRDTDEINIVMTLRSGDLQLEVPSNAMSLYSESGFERTGVTAGGVNIPAGFSGTVYTSFLELDMPEGWDWSSVDVSLELTGLRYSQSGHVAYNYRDIVIDDFTAVYGRGIPASVKFLPDSTQSANTGEEFRRPIGVLVTDSDGDPVEGVEVTFSFPESGASAVPESYSVLSGASGIAEVRISANEYDGAYEVRASVGDLTDSIRLSNIEPETVSESESGEDSATPAGFTALHAVGVLVLLVLALSISLISVYNKNRYN